jgi:hypothetical protein
MALLPQPAGAGAAPLELLQGSTKAQLNRDRAVQKLLLSMHAGVQVPQRTAAPPRSEAQRLPSSS